MDWTDTQRRILDALDLVAEYRALGLDVVGREPNASGWVPARAMGQDDRNPSAGINVGSSHPQRGRYKEFTGEGCNLSFFEFAAAKAGKFPDWKEARKHYAERTGVKMPRGPQPQCVADSLKLRDFNEALAASWCRHKPPVEPWAVRRAGGRLAGWPVPSELFTCMALPVFGPQLTNDSPIGWTIWNITGRELTLKGKDGRSTGHKMLSVKHSQAGLMGVWALERLDAAEVIWKVEGPTDMLALMSAIPPELQEKHVVLTNSQGTLENMKPDIVALFAGKRINVLHDRDADGEKGGLRQAELLAAVAEEVRWVELPYQLEEKHGRDLRDYLAEGHTYQDLLALADAGRVLAKTETGTSADRDPYARYEDICRALGLYVIGDKADLRVVVFSEQSGRGNEIKNVGMLSKATLAQICGPVVDEKVHESNEGAPGMYHLRTVREAIGFLAYRNRLTHESSKGPGVWLGRDRDCLILVGSSEVLTWDFDREQLERQRRPYAGGYLLDLSYPEPWFQPSRLDLYLQQARDLGWRKRALQEAVTWIGLWNWAGDLVPHLFTGLAMATWLQSIWSWRPHVAIRGESTAGKSVFFRGLSEQYSRLGLLSMKPSEAGLRQAIGTSGRAVFVDEFENDLHRAKILELLRTSGRGAKQLRGTANQEGREFHLQHIVWVAATELNLERQPDANRFICVDLNKPPPEKHGNVDDPDVETMRDLGARLLAIAIRFARDALAVVDRLRRHRLPGFEARTLESYAPAAALMGLAMEEEPEAILARFLTARGEDAKQQGTDQEEALEAILASSVSLGRGEQATVAQLLTRKPEVGDIEALERVGIKVSGGQHCTTAWDEHWKRSALLIDHKTVARYLMKGTPWEGQSLEQILCRLPGAKRVQVYLAGRRPRGVSIPWKLVEEKFTHWEDEQTEIEF